LIPEARQGTPAFNIRILKIKLIKLSLLKNKISSNTFIFCEKKAIAMALALFAEKYFKN